MIKQLLYTEFRFHFHNVVAGSEIFHSLISALILYKYGYRNKVRFYFPSSYSVCDRRFFHKLHKSN